MTLKQTLQSDLTAAMKARDQVRAGTLRMALAAVMNAQVAGDRARELSDDEVLQVLTKEAKKRREAATAYDDAKRPELAEQERAELTVLQDYLPAQLTEQEIQALVTEAIAQTGAHGMAGMGKVMKVVQPETAGRADGARVAALVKQALTS